MEYSIIFPKWVYVLLHIGDNSEINITKLSREIETCYSQTHKIVEILYKKNIIIKKYISKKTIKISLTSKGHLFYINAKNLIKILK